ncbi:hypothetical protein FRC98_17000 [Lujinxingia vulgaris]|uniref:DUF2231 domain-containing protein n=1 Tax=Lujinxingia vulgaris TaxID=2600176 RepID=A0A5C6X0B1_9DELT|nr:DUF2231 domain-containing protein [Lujinxingia vulgaris]TXD35168.1 hypothetical protein FRC98_17000 [Lujinxingia vulgaris]
MELSLLHPKVVHFPMALAILMPLLTAGLLLAWWRGWLPRRSFVIALLFQLVLGVTSFAALQTGEVDEEVAERVVPHEAIEEHEEAAEQFFWAVVIVLGVFVASGAIRKESIAKGTAVAALVGTVVVAGLGYRVGEAGGDLVYEHGAAEAFQPGARAPQDAADGVDRDSQ